jgi:hypothetical protein
MKTQASYLQNSGDIILIYAQEQQAVPAFHPPFDTTGAT